MNNAGYGVFGSIEETPGERVRALFDTNVLGLLNLTRAALPVLRRQRAGHIVTMGSSADYLDTVGTLIQAASTFDGHEPGIPSGPSKRPRPRRLTQPPRCRPLGRDSVELVAYKLAHVAGELASWREVSLSTDYPSGSS
ncbi:SDR family NAD(P)-dependent oxidoreductase [Cryptosporangium minutisporangium]|uniref:Uncharacterized protein n=1 Tax=Cryptosporangium minutisporangium TaxID=113569 RepID=A0ABP6T104_9ACTN